MAEKGMSKLCEKKLVFVSGCEGSGTTMLLKFLSRPEFSVGLGGNWWTRGCKPQYKVINEITEFIWNRAIEKSPGEKEAGKRVIRNIEIPDNITHVIYKRSSPFINTNYFPKMLDLFDFSSSVKIIIMKRDFRACAASLVRRGFSRTIDEAAKRTKESIIRLRSELERVDKSLYKIICYEDIVAKPGVHQEELENFLNFPEGSLKKHRNCIRRPSIRSRIILKRHWNFLDRFFWNFHSGL